MSGLTLILAKITAVAVVVTGLSLAHDKVSVPPAIPQIPDTVKVECHKIADQEKQNYKDTYFKDLDFYNICLFQKTISKGGEN